MFKIQKIDRNNKQETNIARTIRFPEDLFNAYKDLSNKTGHSFNSLVLASMRYAYKDLSIDEDLK